MTNNFCAEPWKQIFIGPDSKVKTCCAGRTNLGDLKEKNIDDILNGSALREIKESILKGEWHENCGLCKDLENRGVNSQRKRTEDEVANINFYKENVDFHVPEILDIRWSNTCNLACNYCMPYFSSVWASIKKEYQTPPRNYDGVLFYVKKNKEKNKKVWLLGGEPFLQKDNLELLKILPPDAHITVVTNLSTDIENNPILNILKERYNSSLNAEAKIDIGISFDTIGNKFEYVRHNASWEKFTYNLELLKNLFPIKTLSAMPLYSIYSAYNLMEYYEFIVKNNLAIRWQKIEGPWELNVNYMTEPFRKKAIEEIEQVWEKYYDENNSQASLNEWWFSDSSKVTTDDWAYTPGLGLESLQNIKQSLMVPGEKTIGTNQILKYHEELETLYHRKKYKFTELWGDLFYE